MAHFYGELKGTRGDVSRLGDKTNGLRTTAAGWGGAVTTELFVVDGKDYYRVMLTPWKSSGGTSRVIAEGFLDATVTSAVLP
jgi:hypothetical protein